MSTVQATPSTTVETLYHEHHGWLFHWLCKKVGCRHNAADLAQDAFCRLLAMSDPGSLRQPRAFLTTTATRLLIDDARRRRIERLYLEARAVATAGLSAPSSEHIAEVVEGLDAIARMLEGLAEKPRRAFVMSRLDGLRHADIADALGVSKSMVKQYIARALVHCYQVVYGPENARNRG